MNRFAIYLLGYLLALPLSVGAQIPQRAFEHEKTIRYELTTYFPELPYRHYVPGLIEKESCIHLKHKNCWSSLSELKTSRELGRGLGQVTKAFNLDGSVRFDALQENVDRHPAALRGVTWSNIMTKPDAQIRIIVFMLKASYDKLYEINDPYERVAMMDAAYNGGLGGVRKERLVCSLTKGCDKDKWFDHIERHCKKSSKPMAAYGNRSICDIHRDHVRSVLKVKMPKYELGYFSE